LGRNSGGSGRGSARWARLLNSAKQDQEAAARSPTGLPPKEVQEICCPTPGQGEDEVKILVVRAFVQLAR